MSELREPKLRELPGMLRGWWIWERHAEQGSGSFWRSLRSVSRVAWRIYGWGREGRKNRALYERDGE